jgi:beta-glucanase (GH16 family)
MASYLDAWKNIIEPGGYWTSTFGTASWPACGEIDIMEHWGTNQNVVSSAVHHPINGNLSVGEYISNAQNIAGVSTDFHIYAVEWDAQKITFSVDGINHLTYNPAVKNQYTWPFNAEQYLLLNVAIEPSVTAGFVQSAMEVDYVRVYQQTTLENNNLEKENNLVLFPNPASNEITLKTNENLLGSTVSVCTLLGQELDSLILNSEEITLNLSNYQSGIYILKVNSATGIQSYKFIKK